MQSPQKKKIDEIRPIKSNITETIIAQKSNQNTSAGFQTHTQSTPVNLNMNKTETSEKSPLLKNLKSQFQPVLL